MMSAFSFEVLSPSTSISCTDCNPIQCLTFHNLKAPFLNSPLSGKGRIRCSMYIWTALIFCHLCLVGLRNSSAKIKNKNLCQDIGIVLVTTTCWMACSNCSIAKCNSTAPSVPAFLIDPSVLLSVGMWLVQISWDACYLTHTPRL